MRYSGGVAVLISVDVFQRLMGYLKPSQALFVCRVGFDAGYQRSGDRVRTVRP
jgi:hypothetical protein